MSSRNHDERAVSFAVPDEADDWLADEATRRGESRDEICRRLVTASAAVATDDDPTPTAESTDSAVATHNDGTGPETGGESDD
ncbi:hypothetical protein C478_16842 [Natrinema thermotolerans DSM 11552]|uniref:hypothetical protein n=1 Tax=Natrinema sp. H-ect1 TaxID=3242700 RepID=UPI0002B1D267|nr:hypothetical protein C478_16842 [Natrinema thermotolerans DSM 11552]